MARSKESANCVITMNDRENKKPLLKLIKARVVHA